MYIVEVYFYSQVSLRNIHVVYLKVETLISVIF